jgi:hypothetical protein
MKSGETSKGYLKTVSPQAENSYALHFDSLRRSGMEANERRVGWDFINELYENSVAATGVRGAPQTPLQSLLPGAGHANQLATPQVFADNLE